LSRFGQGFVSILQTVGDCVHHSGHAVIEHLKAQWDTIFRITCITGQLAPNPSRTELSAKSTRLGVPGNGFREVGTPSQAHRVLRQRL
jgi:hypothetical protein